MTKDLDTLLEDCRARGVQLRAGDDGSLNVDASRAALTPGLLARLKALQADVLAILGRNSHDRPRPANHPSECPHDAGTVMRPTVQGDRPFCPLCGHRVGFDAPYPWA